MKYFATTVFRLRYCDVRICLISVVFNGNDELLLIVIFEDIVGKSENARPRVDFDFNWVSSYCLCGDREIIR